MVVIGCGCWSWWICVVFISAAVVVRLWSSDERQCFAFGFFIFLGVIMVDFEMILLQIWMDLSCDHGGRWLWVYLACGLIFSWVYGLSSYVGRAGEDRDTINFFFFFLI